MVIFHLNAPHGRICPKFCIAVEVVDIIILIMDTIICDKYFGVQLKYVDSVGVEIGASVNGLSHWLLTLC